MCIAGYCINVSFITGTAVLSVLDKNVCGTEVVELVSTRLPQSLLYQFLEYKKTTQKQGKFSSLKVEYLENGIH